MKKTLISNTILGLMGLAISVTATAVPLPGGTQDPLKIPKYVTPLVIPPVMNHDATGNNNYDIAVRQFSQQILPGGIWNTINGRADAFNPTPVWSYGPAADPTPAVAPAANSQFNYPAYTIENTVNTTTNVDWINDLVVNPDACANLRLTNPTLANDPLTVECNALPHLLPIDRSLHWANPEQLPCTVMNPAPAVPKTKDCRPDPVINGNILQQPYKGPVPIITHVHGAHVGPESDGYPEAWFLPNANNIPLTYAKTGTLVNQYGTTTNDPLTPYMASFSYPNTQPSTTLWYHDHALGMTRNNVYAGPAGFWLIREAGGGESGLMSGTLPGPAPVAGQAVLDLNIPGNPVRAAIREIPIVVQDRSFNSNGTLFYPDARSFFEGLNGSLTIPYIGSTKQGVSISDISPIWNPEFFGNTMVVNGVTWPVLEVEPDLYRFRMLNGCNSRFINLSMFVVDPVTNAVTTQEVPFYQIGAEQSLLPNVVKVETGQKTTFCKNTAGPCTAPNTNVVTATSDPMEALLMGLAERADVIVDFTGLAPGTRVRMINTAPDAPFSGFPDIPSDPLTTGQVMEFTVGADDPANPIGENFTAPQDLLLSLPDAGDPANVPGTVGAPRDMALIEEESQLVCATISLKGQIFYDNNAMPDPLTPGQCLVTKKKGKVAAGSIAASVPFAPKAAVLGINGMSGGSVTLWSDSIATNPAVGATETWELWNHTVDGHPIHLHLVKFKVINRQTFDPATFALDPAGLRPPEATEAGWKDTVIAYPGEVTRVNATFDIAGLYVWHCHIVEHEDNEMMVPYCVVDSNGTGPGCQAVP